MNKFLKSMSTLGFGVVASAVLFGTATAQSSPRPVFNYYGDVPSIGNEADFVRITDRNGGNTTEACEDGQTVNVWLYVHNGSEPEFNGENNDGPGVAVNTNLRVSENNGVVTGAISADNAATVTDTATITCGSREINLKYNGQQSFSTTDTTGNYTIVGDPANGAQIGYPGGVVPGCWEYRATVVVQYEVEVVEEPVEEIALECNVLDLVAVNRSENSYTIGVEGSITPEDAGAVVNSTIAITGPNTNASFDGPSVDYTFQQDGTYTITGTVNFEKDGEVVGSVNCVRTVNIETEKPPVVVVTENPNEDTTNIVTTLPNTGAGTNIALFAAIVVAASFAYRKYAALRS